MAAAAALGALLILTQGCAGMVIPNATVLAAATTSETPGCQPLVGGDPELDDSYTLWLRYTQPRVVSSLPLHSAETVVTASLEQILDHMDPMSATWTQRYLRNSDSYAPGGPAFVMLSGTDRYSSDWLREGHMADLARRFKADRYFLMTRFYDPKSPPTADTSVDSLQFLSTEQVVQDVRVFLEHLTDKGLLQAGQRVFLFGAGYGGAVATWVRQRYPNLVHGVVASSATVDARYEVPKYFPVVSEAVSWYHQKSLRCEDVLKRAFTQFDAALATSNGRQNFNEYFAPCTPLAADSALSAEDHAHILGLVASVVADLVQEDEDGPGPSEEPGRDKLFPYCFVLATSTDNTMKTLGLLTTTSLQGRCLQASFTGLQQKLSASGWRDEVNAEGHRPWLWQQCTELGQFASSSGSQYSFPYSTRITLDFYTKLCEGVFGEDVMQDLIQNILQIQRTYGGKSPKASNVVFVKGDLDPWKHLSPDNNFKGDEVYVYSVLRASHAHDMFPRDDYDPPWMKSTRKKIEAVIGDWIKFGSNSTTH